MMAIIRRIFASWRALILIPLVLFFIVYLLLFLLPFPELDAFLARSYGTVITDRNGTVLRVLPAADGVRREWASLDEIPSGAVKIFVRAEDRRFRFHPGVDIISMAGSLNRNLRAGRVVSGASTITMQLARLVNPHSGGVQGKMREIRDALRIEAKLSKNQILELWINNIPFGSNIEGLPAITRARFGICIKELDETRAALLAAVPRRPSFFDPALNPEAAVSRALALSERYRLGLVACELKKAAKESARPGRGPEDPRTPFLAPHFTERLGRILSGTNTRHVHSTLDLELQRYAEHLLGRELALLTRNRVSNGAILVMENETGAVRAYVGSASWFNEEIAGRIDGVRFRAQPGSCLKPFLYALALDSGFSPTDILPDIPTVFGGGEAYIPSNFNNRFNGPVRFRVALASSLNIPSVYLLEQLGVQVFEEYLISLGFDSVRARMGSYGLGLALGNAEVSLEEMVRAFTAFPRMGSAVELRFIETEEPLHLEPLMSHYAAWLISDILAERPSRFLGFGPAPVMVTPFESMFKTGTANQFQHIWALAATGRYTVGVWMGNFSGETVVGTTGSAIPARIAAQLLASLEASGRTALLGPLPPGTVELQICTISGLPAGPHCPGRTREILRTENIQQACYWHGVQGRSYPPEFQTWVAETLRSAQVRQEGRAHIRMPVNGSVHFMNPSLPPGVQALRIETAGFSAGARIYSNGFFMGNLNHAGVYPLPLSRGFHSVTVEDINGAFATVNFEVR